MSGKIKRANAGDIMNSNVFCAKENDNMENIAKIMAEKKIGCVIVVNDAEEPTGIITESDLVRLIAKKGREFFDLSAVDVMNKPLVTIIPSMDVEKVEKEMKRRNIKHLPVVASKKLVGIITTRDVINYLAKWEPK